MTDQAISDENLHRLQQRASRDGLSVDDLLARLLDIDASSPAPDIIISHALLLEKTTDIFALFDLDLRYVYINPIIKELTGIDSRDMIGKTDRELGMPEENLRFWRTAWDEVIETRQEKIITFSYPTLLGIRHFEARLTPIMINDDQLIYLLAISRDVTERKQSEQMLKDITNRLPGMILRYELLPDGRDAVPYVSEGITRIYELTVEEALNDVSMLWAKVHPDDLPGFAESIQQSARNLTIWDYEWRIRMNDGSIKWIAGLGTPHRMEDGRIIWHTLLLDITHRKQLEDQQRELLEQLELAVETAKLGIWRLNLDTHELVWNDRQFEIYGIKREDFVPVYETWRDSVHPEDVSTAESRMSAALTMGKVYDVEFRIIRPDGEIRHIHASADVFRNPQEQTRMMVGINMDVTERVRTEQIMLERERLSASLNIEKERIATFQRIVAKLEHDIRIPLSIISTSREILSKYFERIDEEQRRKRLENIEKQLSYVTELLNDLTSIREVAADEQPFQLAAHNLKVLCQIALKDIQETSGQNHVLRFDAGFEHDLVMIDDVLMNRILLNLLSNAVKYSPAGSPITLKLSATGDQIRLKIVDQGVGIPEDELDNIFEPFYRIKTDHDLADGRGLGLSIVKECVQRHNGHIFVESVYGHGTTFTVELPLIPA